ncbi:TVP38/TMEM64 family protein [Shewanella amazonensis]|uniref:TVP38/TMEM64 family membrane protein n=1 Tax=Shewanella amazonensis (strain ATCC BAA-1098 / SB2B) TaxID=326297 RepID=A1S1R9_SHEAM|nr:VTT domain-containing protein [Shewanella amazonensis]ABL98325.1 conserved hypothetical protein [Shewanella amazonensis SB2B]
MKTHLKRLGKLSLTLTVLVLLMLAAREGWFDHLTDSNWVARFVQEGGVQALVVLLLAGSLFTAVGGPRQAIAFVCGFAMGGLYGALFSTLATLLGCLTSFYFARLTVRSSLSRRFGHRLQRFEALLAQKTWLKVLMIRLLPVGSNLLTNLLAGTTRVGVGGFLLGSALGYLPQMLIFSFAGAGIGLADHIQLGISVVLFILSSAIGAYLYRSHLKRQVDEIAEES